MRRGRFTPQLGQACPLVCFGLIGELKIILVDFGRERRRVAEACEDDACGRTCAVDDAPSTILTSASTREADAISGTLLLALLQRFLVDARILSVREVEVDLIAVATRPPMGGCYVDGELVDGNIDGAFWEAHVGLKASSGVG